MRLKKTSQTTGLVLALFLYIPVVWAALLKPYLEEARNKQNVEDIYMLLTDVPKEESVVRFWPSPARFIRTRTSSVRFTS